MVSRHPHRQTIAIPTLPVPVTMVLVWSHPISHSPRDLLSGTRTYKDLIVEENYQSTFANDTVSSCLKYPVASHRERISVLTLTRDASECGARQGYRGPDSLRGRTTRLETAMKKHSRQFQLEMYRVAPFGNVEKTRARST
jgi:hypothetical protein